MKRTVKKNPPLDKTVTKKTASTKISAPEKPLTARKKSAAPKTEKPVKQSKTQSAVKISASTVRAKKTATTKNSKPEKSVALKNKSVAVAKKSTVKTAGKSAAKVPVSAKKAQKPISAKIAEQKKPVSRTKKAVVAEEKPVRKSKTATSAKTVTAVLKTKKPVAANQTAKPVKKKIVQTDSPKKPKSKKEQILIKKTGEKVKPAVRKGEVVAAAKNTKTDKTIKPIAKKASKKIENKLEAVAAKAGKKSVKTTKTVDKKVEKKPLKKTVQKAATPVLPVIAKPVKKKIKPIGSAVVRGKAGRYDFEVFPLDAELKDGSAIYVISKRITDKSGRGHHKFVCIGQTESLLGEIKRHKKDKCIKRHNANVICLLREESAANRLKIETDLREAHTIACNQK